MCMYTLMHDVIQHPRSQELHNIIPHVHQRHSSDAQQTILSLYDLAKWGVAHYGYIIMPISSVCVDSGCSVYSMKIVVTMRALVAGVYDCHEVMPRQGVSH